MLASMDRSMDRRIQEERWHSFKAKQIEGYVKCWTSFMLFYLESYVVLFNFRVTNFWTVQSESRGTISVLMLLFCSRTTRDMLLEQWTTVFTFQLLLSHLFINGSIYEFNSSFIIALLYIQNHWFLSVFAVRYALKYMLNSFSCHFIMVWIFVVVK